MKSLQEFITEFNFSDTDAVSQLNPHPIPLHDASKRGCFPEVIALINQGADVNAKDINGYMALHLASLNSHCEVVELLLTHGAQLNVKSNINRESALSIAVSKHNFKLAQLLLYQGADCNITEEKTVLHIAAESGDVNIVRLLLDQGVDPNMMCEGKSPLFLARLSDCISYSRRQKVVQVLLERGADIRMLPIDALILVAEEDSQAYLYYLIHGWDSEKFGIDSFRRIYDKNTQEKTMIGRVNLYQTLSKTLEQIGIQIESEKLPEVFYFLARVPYWSYHQPLPQSSAEYFLDNHIGLNLTEDIIWDVCKKLYGGFYIPVDLIDVMLEPLFERQSHLSQLVEHFDLPKEVIAALYDALKNQQSSLYQFWKDRLERDWVNETGCVTPSVISMR